MNIRNLISNILIILLLGIIQVFFLKNLALFGVAFVFVYLLVILMLPVSTRSVPLILIAFVLGFVIDLFYETIGMHTAAATFMAFFRSIWLRAISPTGGYMETENPSLSEMGIGWYLSYSIPLIFAFCIVFFTADQWGVGGFLEVLNKSFFSSIFTCLLIILVQLLFFKRRRGI